MMAIQVLHNADGVWVSHFLEMLRRCMVPWKRCKVLGIRRGRQERRWLDSIRNDLSETCLTSYPHTKISGKYLHWLVRYSPSKTEFYR